MREGLLAASVDQVDVKAVSEAGEIDQDIGELVFERRSDLRIRSGLGGFLRREPLEDLDELAEQTQAPERAVPMSEGRPVHRVRVRGDPGISRTTAYELVRSGALPCVRLGRRIVITRRTIEELLGTPVPAST